MNEEKNTPIPSRRGKLETARKIGRFLCLALILVICGSTVYNVFRLMDSFEEKAPPPVKNAEVEEVPPLFPVVTFDPDGRWEIAGLSADVANSPPLLPVPETAVLLGVRNDRNGKPQMQFYEIPEDAVSAPDEKNWEQVLVDSWKKQGWTANELKMPEIISYECQKSDEYRFVQFFSDHEKYYLLLSRAGQ